MKKLIVAFALFLSAGAFAQTADTAKKAVATVAGFSNNNLQPLIIVDGVKYKGELKTLNPNDIESMSVLKSSKETSLYGAEGLNGVILITTKNAKAKNTFSTGPLTPRTDTLSHKPLYIIDGVKANADDLKGINPNDIDNVSVLKNAKATTTYGADGIYGVIIVTTKAYKKAHNDKKAEAESKGKQR